MPKAFTLLHALHLVRDRNQARKGLDCKDGAAPLARQGHNDRLHTSATLQ